MARAPEWKFLVAALAGWLALASLIYLYDFQAIEGEPPWIRGLLRSATKGNLNLTLQGFVIDDEMHGRGMSLGFEKLQVIIDALRQQEGPDGARAVLELGCHAGDSTLAIFLGLNSWPGSTVISTEANFSWLAGARRIVPHGLSGSSFNFVPVLLLPSQNFSEFVDHMLTHAKISFFDAVFFDHDEARFLPDLQVLMAKRALRPGTLLFADNVGRKAALSSYIDFVAPGEDALFETRLVPIRTPYADKLAVSRYLGGHGDVTDEVPDVYAEL